MIHQYQTINLFGKLLFEKVILSPPFKKPHSMPDEACFLYVIEGEYNSISEKDQLRVKTQESVLMKCGSYMSQMKVVTHSEKYEAVAVHFFPDILKRVYENKLPGFLKPVPENAPGPTQSKLRSDELIHKYIDSILFYFENQELITDEILELKLKEIILLLNQTSNAPAIRNILSNLFTPQSYSLRQVVEAHVYSSISVKELAGLCHLSLSTFKREFNKIYKSTPANYLKTRKLNKAAELLQIPGTRISDIAYDYGFSDVANFSRAFKQKHGISPSAYAKKPN